MSKLWGRAVIGLLILVPAACGGDDDDSVAVDVATSPAGTAGAGPTDTDADDDPGPAPAGDAGARVVIATTSEPDNLDAHVSDTVSLATWSINEALVDFDDEGGLIPVLAAGVPEQIDDDPTRWRVALREDVTFTNGEPFDAAAVVANVERIFSEELGSQLLSELETIDHAEVVDDHTVEFVTKDPDPILDTRLAILRMVPPVAAADAEFSNNPIGTGSMLFDSWERGERIVLKANPEYWGDPKPTIGEVELRVIPDEGTRMAALSAGEVDMALNVPPDQTQDIPQLLESTAPTQMSMIRINLAKAPYSDVKFRQALAYALDPATINDSLFGGRYEVNKCQPVSPTTFGFNPELEAYPYDPAKAEELLAEVAIPEGFTVQFDATSGLFAKERELAEAIASYWKAVGLDVEITFNELDPWLDKLFGKSSDLQYNETDQAFRNSARQVGIFVQPDGLASMVGNSYPELDPLIETALTASDNDTRQQAYADIWEVVCDEAIFVYNLDRVEIWGMRDGISYEPGSGELSKFYFHRLQVTD